MNQIVTILLFFIILLSSCSLSDSQNAIFESEIGGTNTGWSDPKLMDDYAQFIDDNYDIEFESNIYDPYLYVFNEPYLHQGMDGFYFRVIRKSYYGSCISFSLAEKNKYAEMAIKFADVTSGQDHKEYLFLFNTHIKDLLVLDSVRLKLRDVDFTKIRSEPFNFMKQPNYTVEILIDKKYYYFGNLFGGSFSNLNMEEDKISSVIKVIYDETNFLEVGEQVINPKPVQTTNWRRVKPYQK